MLAIRVSPEIKKPILKMFSIRYQSIRTHPRHTQVAEPYKHILW